MGSVTDQTPPASTDVLSAPTAGRVSEEAVWEVLRGVIDPELGSDIVELGMAKGVRIEPDGTVHVTIALTTSGCPLRAEIQRNVRTRVGALAGVTHVKLDWTELDQAGKAAAMERARRNIAERAEQTAVPSSTKVVMVASGKGGVGKSSVTTNLSIALAQRGHSVAVVDADVWGFSIPRMLGVDRPPTLIDQMIVPPERYGVRLISMGFFVEDDQPVIWRGPMLHKALEQFLTDVFWDDPDYLLVDLPPGTGDVSISLSQYLPRAELYVVTTPQPAAQTVAQRAAFMANKVRLDLKGVIENMSWFTGDDGTRYEIFGSGGGKTLADKVDVPLLGQIPLVPALREGGDSGVPITVSEPDSEAARAFATIAERVDTELAPTRRRHRELRIN